MHPAPRPTGGDSFARLDWSTLDAVVKPGVDDVKPVWVSAPVPAVMTSRTITDAVTASKERLALLAARLGCRDDDAVPFSADPGRKALVPRVPSHQPRANLQLAWVELQRGFDTSWASTGICSSRFLSLTLIHCGVWVSFGGGECP